MQDAARALGRPGTSWLHNWLGKHDPHTRATLQENRYRAACALNTYVPFARVRG